MTTSASPTTRSAEENPSPSRALAAARPPVGTGPAPLVAQLIGIALIALGVVGVEETLTRTGIIPTGSWITAAVNWADGRRPVWWVLLLAVVVALIGLVLLLAVIRPRPRKALTVTATTGVFLTTRDLARMMDGVLDGTNGITDVESAATVRRLRVTATTIAPREENSALETELRRRAAPLLDTLSHPPRMSVTIRNEDLT